MYKCPNCGANLDSASERCDCQPQQNKKRVVAVKYYPPDRQLKKLSPRLVPGANVKTLGTPIRGKNDAAGRDFSSFFGNW